MAGRPLRAKSAGDAERVRAAKPPRHAAGSLRAGVDPASPTPLYHQIFSLLRDGIYDGRSPGGSYLPSEQELSSEFNVSRITAKRALDELANEGLVVREQGRGTRVCINTHSTSVRGSVKGLVHSLHANGRGSVQLLDFDYVAAAEDVAARLGLNVGDEVQRAIRVWQGEDGPFSHLTTFVPGHLGRAWTRDDLMRRAADIVARKRRRDDQPCGRANHGGAGRPGGRRAPCGRGWRTAVDDIAHGVRYQRPLGGASRGALSARPLPVFGVARSLSRSHRVRSIRTRPRAVRVRRDGSLHGKPDHQIVELGLGQGCAEILQGHGVGGDRVEPDDGIGIERLPGIELVARALGLGERNAEPVGIDLERGVVGIKPRAVSR